MSNINQIEFQYHKQEEADQFAFYQIPKELFTISRYKKISTDAKLLYGLLRDRHQLSTKNNWVDADGNIYIIFTREEAMEIMGFKKDYITKIFKELSTVNLIKDVRQGLNKPNIIYVGKIVPESKENQWKAISPPSGQRQNRVQESVNTATSNTNNNNTDMSNSHTQETKNCKSVCVDIESVLGEKINQKKIQELINTKGIETVQEYINNWDKYRHHANSTQASYFIYAIQNELPEPQAKKSTYTKQIQQFNFDQRSYTEEQMEQYYTNVMD